MDKIEIFKKLVDENPQSSNAWYLLGMEYSANKNYSEALKAFSEALNYCDNETKKLIISEISELLAKESNSINTKVVETQRHEGLQQDNKINIDTSFEDELEDEFEAESEEEEQSSGNYGNIIPFQVIEGKRPSKSFNQDEERKQVSFNDVGGLDNLKETIKMKIVKPFINPSLFDKFKKKVGGGILLFGPPGCGKTYIAKATAGECNANFIPVHITDILDPYLGVSAQNIKDIFSTARAKKPCVLFFDEIDTIGYNRAKLSSEHMRPIVDQLLSEIEGIDSSTHKMLIMGATNMPWDVDSALRRPGRFDKTVFVPPPDDAAREVIFKLKLSGKPVGIIDYSILAKHTELYSGADIENVVEVATENVLLEIMKTGIERSIEMKDLIEAIKGTKPSTIEWLRTIKNYVKYSNQAGLYDDVDRFIMSHKKLL